MTISKKVLRQTSFHYLVSLLLAIIILISPLLGVQKKQADKKLNVLLITIDTLRPDRLSCYSPQYVKTPRIDGLAAKGVLFERAFAHDPLTLPSHTNILLGKTALAHGVDENSKSVVPQEFQTLAELLKSYGYETGAFVGAFPLDSRFGLDQGFDVYDDMYPSQPATGLAYSERTAEETIRPALEWLSKRQGSWFCWVHLWDPHFPYSAPEPYASNYKEDPYSGEVAYVDHELGKLLDEVENKGWLDLTLIILTGDHGEALGEHGENTHSYFAYNSTVSIPLIISGPMTDVSRVKEYVSHVDIFPTVCDTLGIKTPPALHGESLRLFFSGKTRKANAIYFEAMDAYKNRGWAPLRGIIMDGKKYFDSPIPELYDLEKDFNEETNLVPETDVSSFKKRLEEKIESDSSPLRSQAAGTVDKETLEKLRSLGYTASPVTQVKESYGPQDDLKTLLPLEQKLNVAVDFKNLGKIPESVRLLEDIIQTRKDFVKAYDHLYQIYVSQGLVDDGLMVLERGFTANPNNYMMISNYGTALIKQGRNEKGAQILEQSLFIFDKDAEVWNMLGVAYWQKGDFERALEHYEKALALDPGDAIINVNIGSFYVAMSQTTKRLEDAQRSVEYFQRAIADDPLLASAYNGLGGTMKLLGNNDEAIANWEKALELNPGYSISVYNLAYAYLEKGNKTQALEYCQRYLSIRGNALSVQERAEMDELIRRCKY